MMRANSREFTQMLKSEVEMGHHLPSEIVTQFGLSNREVFLWLKEQETHAANAPADALQQEIALIQRQMQRLN
ncbi:hypothetical protein LZP69_12350 [Shewanella sp. AS1]|uniref:hypothetical protein n=1 Tax=Shewanella sp. AS1 TaxID=2907626 RepID=UPI001F3C7FA6|nr:hypothetical protein [Shewanella sp. AS1]MCE9679955.1 hypothetical protein [Shewanella sp. AS1]